MSNNILKKDNTNRIRTLQGARFLFVVFIYLSHCVTSNVVKPFDFGGDCGVAFFFTLSGFVLSWGYGLMVSRGEFASKQFFWRHFWRLYPLHLLLFVAMLLLDMRIGATYDWQQLTASLLLVQSWIPSNHTLYNVNPVAWFLCDTLFFYVIFKWVYNYIMSTALRVLIGIFVVFAVLYLAVAAQVPHDMVNCTLYANPLLRTVDFALGVMAYRIYKNLSFKHFKPCQHVGIVVLPCSVLVGAMLFGIYQLLDGNGCRAVALFWPVMPVFVVTLVAIDGKHNLMSRMLSSPMMRWLGSISFELFMVHLLAMRLTAHFFSVGISLENDIVYFAVAFVVAVIMAWMLHMGFVKPITNVINRKILRS